MKKERVRNINEQPVLDGPVVYWMNREIRTADNWALLYAQEVALKQRVPLLVVYTLATGPSETKSRQWFFKMQGLREVNEGLAEKNIPFFLMRDDEEYLSQDKMLSWCASIRAGAVITDFSPLRVQLDQIRKAKEKLECCFQTVDAHNIVPVWTASSKQEYGARTLRPKLYRLLAEYLEVFPSLKKHPHSFEGAIPAIDWEQLLSDRKQQRHDTGGLFLPGEQEGRRRMRDFISTRLEAYALKRNDALLDGQSNLSPYFHFGMIAPARAALLVVESVGQSVENILHSTKNKAKVEERELTLIDHAGAFLEELIVRRELADNFCFYNKKYDRTEGFPDWAKKSLDRTRDDIREYTYTQREFEQAETHDELWNAAQKELLKSGKMHGYMRMYWAKKILEWTKSPEEALRIAIFLNDTYELDGHDPNGYAGIAWSMGGVHDRAWFSRPIFGSIRYMARSGAEKKFDVKRYIEKWNT